MCPSDVQQADCTELFAAPGGAALAKANALLMVFPENPEHVAAGARTWTILQKMNLITSDCGATR